MPTSRTSALRGNDALNRSDLDSTKTGQPLRGTSSRERRQGPRCGSSQGHRARAARLPPRFAVSQVKGKQRHRRYGVKRACRALQHNAAFHKVAPVATLALRLVAQPRAAPGPGGFAERRVMSGAPCTCQASMCALKAHGLVGVTVRAPGRLQPRAAVSQAKSTQPQLPLQQQPQRAASRPLPLAS